MECLAVCSRPQHGRVSSPLAGPKHRPQMTEVFSALGMYVEPASWLTHAKSRGERNDALWSLPGTAFDAEKKSCDKRLSQTARLAPRESRL
jgi:hypothetical protein